MKPADVNKSNKDQVWLTLYGYEANFTEEIFKVVKVFRGDPNMYERENIIGKFYEEELSAVNKKDDMYRVEKKVKGKNMVLVSGWVMIVNNSSIPEENIQDLK